MIALEQAVAIIEAQETWGVNDDLCECTYQRMGNWVNPYIGETYEVRLCCLYAEFEKQYPHLFRRQQVEPAIWNGEADMPRSIWHRQLSKHLGVSVTEARQLNLEPPKGKPIVQKPTLFLPYSGDYVEVTLG